MLSRIHAQLGMDRIRIAVTGSEPIPRGTHEFFLGLGLPLCEGYGMTECAAGATVDRPERIKIGTVGRPLAAALAERHQLTDRSLPALAAHPRVLKSLQEGIDAANSKLSRVEQIKRFAVLPEVWTPGSDHLTATGKLRRKPIATTYAATIDSLYG
ncbi:AMP-binding protein [Nocardia sp. NPDC051981]|uniref:AMP-binding protein n=1 Tax=Nocardia sp. NPDC051981 TaxID=3155417 RepID=UPI0034345720